VVWVGIDPLVPDEEAIVEPLRDGLRELGYIEGKSIVFEYRHTNRRPDRVDALIQEQIQRKVDVWDSTPKIAAKQFQLLRELVSTGRRLGLLWNPDIRGSPAFVREARAAADASATGLDLFEMRAPADFEAAFAAMASAGVAAVLVLGSWFTWLHRERLAGLAARHRMPAIYGNRDSVVAGGLMSYGANLADEFRRAAGYIDKILKGSQPADLPVEQPTKFELVVSLKAAKALGIAIPQPLLLRADEVIQ